MVVVNIINKKSMEQDEDYILIGRTSRGMYCLYVNFLGITTFDNCVTGLMV